MRRKKLKRKRYFEERTLKKSQKFETSKKESQFQKEKEFP